MLSHHTFTLLVVLSGFLLQFFFSPEIYFTTDLGKHEFYCVKMRASEMAERNILFPASHFSLGSPSLWLSLPIKVMRTKGPMQLVRATLCFYEPRISHAFKDVRVVQRRHSTHWNNSQCKVVRDHGPPLFGLSLKGFPQAKVES